MAVQRVRVQYGRSGDLQYVAHLDMIRLWERAFRRAGVPVAYSEGHTPRPRLSIASALPIGVTSEAELLDVYLKRRLSPFYFLQRLEQQIPPAIRVLDARDIPVEWPSLQSQVRQAEYRVTVETDAAAHQLERSIQDRLDKDNLPWEHRRDQ
ncbi:MAG: TIGR03936 family radical SAM-associated protein, partial [Dehalococcoidia bacterium]